MINPLFINKKHEVSYNWSKDHIQPKSKLDNCAGRHERNCAPTLFIDISHSSQSSLSNCSSQHNVLLVHQESRESPPLVFLSAIYLLVVHCPNSLDELSSTYQAPIFLLKKLCRQCYHSRSALFSSAEKTWRWWICAPPSSQNNTWNQLVNCSDLFVWYSEPTVDRRWPEICLFDLVFITGDLRLEGVCRHVLGALFYFHPWKWGVWRGALWDQFI